MFPALKLQVAILSLFNDFVNNACPIDHILLLFKFYIYKSPNTHWLNINDLLGNILKIKKLENVTASNSVKKVAA